MRNVDRGFSQAIEIPLLSFYPSRNPLLLKRFSLYVALLVWCFNGGFQPRQLTVVKLKNTVLK